MKPRSMSITFLSKDFDIISAGRTLRSWHSTVCRVDDLVVKVKSFDIKSASKIKEHIKMIAETFNFIPYFLGVVVGGIEVDGKIKPAVMSFHSYAEPIVMPSLKDLWEILSMIAQAQVKGFTLDIKPSNFGRLEGRVVYLDEFGVGKPLPKDIMEDLERIKKKIEQYFKQVRPSQNEVSSNNHNLHRQS